MNSSTASEAQAGRRGWLRGTLRWIGLPALGVVLLPQVPPQTLHGGTHG